MCLQEIPYHDDITAYRLQIKVNHCWAQLVLRWKTKFGIMSLVLFVSCCFLFPQTIKKNITGNANRMEHSGSKMSTHFWCNVGGGAVDIIFTFTALFSNFCGTKKELIQILFCLFHWELLSWYSLWRGRWGIILLLLFF